VRRADSDVEGPAAPEALHRLDRDLPSMLLDANIVGIAVHLDDGLAGLAGLDRDPAGSNREAEQRRLRRCGLVPPRGLLRRGSLPKASLGGRGSRRSNLISM